MVGTNCISTSHALARELLSKTDGFITVSHEDREYIITDYKKVKGHANVDDSVPYWTLCLKECKGNVIR